VLKHYIFSLFAGIPFLHFFGVPHLAACIFSFFSIRERTRIECLNLAGMALTPFPSSVG